MKTRTVVVLLLLVSIAARGSERGTAAQLERVRHDPLALRRFVEAMPKGGDLHNHLSGAVYAESFVRWAAEDHLCIDRTTYGVTPPPCEEPAEVPAEKALADPLLYQHAIDAMSMRQFRPITESGHDHFFRTFPLFGLAARGHLADMLAEVVARDQGENVDYLETMMSPDGGTPARLSAMLPAGLPAAAMRERLLADPEFQSGVAAARRMLDEAEAGSGPLRCTTVDQTGCTLVRYIFGVSRTGVRERVFTELLFGFELASADPRVLAVNPLAPEDAYPSMRHFSELMEFFAYLRPLYPGVGVSTHAGELSPGLVPPEGLRFHIRDSIVIAGAQRIGHGVDIMRETGAEDTLRMMAAKPVPVEICLTSNDVILGIRGKDHPMRTYLRYGVPVVLATDDPGVSRGDLSTEFQRAVEEQGATYPELKAFARNSIAASFLPGASLWRDRSYRAFVAECASDRAGRPLSASCESFLGRSAKARRQWMLEERLETFEMLYPR